MARLLSRLLAMLTGVVQALMTRMGHRSGPVRTNPTRDRTLVPWELVSDLRGDAIRVIFDVGANVGAVTRQLAERFPQADILCFEPVETTFATLCAGLSSVERAHCFALGFSDRPRAETIHLQAHDAWNSVSKNIDRGLGTAEVRLETVDRFCAERGISKIDLLKSDTEGHDLAVLQGAHAMLSRRQIDFVYVEVGFYRQDKGHTYFCDVLDYLQGHALQFQGLFDQDGLRYIEHESEPCYPWANALFVRDALVGMKYRVPYDDWLAQLSSR